MNTNLHVRGEAPREPSFHDAESGRTVLPPIVYTRTPEGWHVPAHERHRWDQADQIQRNLRRPTTTPSASGNPFDCANCGTPLAQVAIDRGYTTCKGCS